MVFRQAVLLEQVKIICRIRNIEERVCCHHQNGSLKSSFYENLQQYLLLLIVCEVPVKLLRQSQLFFRQDLKEPNILSYMEELFSPADMQSGFERHLPVLHSKLSVQCNPTEQSSFFLMISGNPPRHLCSFVLEINFSFSCIDHSSYRYVRISDFFRFPFFIFITYLNHHLTHWLILIPMRQITFFDSFHHRILLIKIPPPP